MAQRGIIRNFKQIDEIVVSGVVPDRYFLNLEAVPSTKTVKHLTLYKYKGTMLRKPCEIFPNLESLLIEQTDMSGIKYLWDLSACNVKRLTVRAVPVFTPVSILISDIHFWRGYFFLIASFVLKNRFRLRLD